LKIVIVDYGLGNLKSVYNAFRRIGQNPAVSENSEDIRNADKLVLPGVGHFKQGMKNLAEQGLIDELHEHVLVQKKPILGICLGLQLFTSYSDEGECAGLQYISHTTKRFAGRPEMSSLKIPHMGWNTVTGGGREGIMNGVTDDDAFYFVHSYYIEPNETDSVSGITGYGLPFVSVVQQDNIYGTQFHPEKSHDPGLKLLKNFCEGA